MKQALKKILIFLAALILLFALFLAIEWVFVIFPNMQSAEGNIAEYEPGAVGVAESGRIDYNESHGAMYINNEIIVSVRASASSGTISSLFDNFDAEVDNSMSDIGIYRLIFHESMTYDDLESIIDEIKADPFVDDAYLNTVMVLENDNQ